MKARDIIAVVGSFFLAFGAVLMSQNVPPWAWWLGQGMVIAGPLMMGARAATARRARQKPAPKQSPKTVKL